MNPLYLLLVITVALVLWEIWFAVALPARRRNALNRGDRPAEMAYLQRIVASTALLPRRLRLNARFRLAAMYMEDGRHKDASEECSRMLASGPGRSAQVNIRRRLADFLEVMGDTAGADQERLKVEQALRSGRQTVNNYISRAKELTRVQRFAEACAAYEQALTIMPARLEKERAQVMVQLAAASSQAGEPAKTVEWAERAIEHNLQPKMASLAHRMAGLGYSTLGSLDQAQWHYQQGLESAETVGNRDEAGKNIVQLAHVQALRGRLDESLRTCQRAVEMLAAPDYRVLQMLEMECYRHVGQLDGARASLERARNSHSHATPAIERRSQATISLGFSWVEAEAGRPDEAWYHLQQATAVFMTDAKMSVSCEGTLAWILALLGRRDEAIRKAQETEARLPQWTQSRRTAQGCCAMPARAYFELGEYARSRECWERYLTLAPDPVYLPMAYWYVGECSLQLGEVEAARHAFQQAARPDIPTRYALQARKWLESE